MTTETHQLRWMDQSRTYRTEAQWEPLKQVILGLANEGYNASQITKVLLSGASPVACDPNLKVSDIRRILAKWGKKTNFNQKQRIFMQKVKDKRGAIGKPPPRFRYKDTKERIDAEKADASLSRNKKKDSSCKPHFPGSIDLRF
ncbi:hypothetical protein ABW20_dc0100297 [Dactylellina cionopaga]|nr:hypothetical protein ABW20_dc0100297 [Dactylellina cionopaga]